MLMLPYSESTDDTWAADMAEQLSRPGTNGSQWKPTDDLPHRDPDPTLEVYRLEAECTRCAHTVTATLWSRAVDIWGKTIRHPVDHPDEFRQQVYVACNCPEPYEGRPEGRSGCGAAGVFAAPWLGDTMPRRRPRAARPEDRRWAERADEIGFTNLAEFRRGAERWQGLVGALTGGFGIIAILQGPESFTNLGHRDWLGVFLLLTFAAAAAANVLAVLAATGPTSVRFYTNSIQVQDLYVHDLLWSAQRLRWSQVCMAIALGGVFAAVGLIWAQS